MGRERMMRLGQVVILILCAGSLAGCRGLEVNSVLRSGEVSIDGVPAEWQGLTTYVENPNSAIGVMNDDQYLYVCFSTPVKSLAAQVLRQGLTVWFDVGGGKDKGFGVHCPMGALPPMADSMRTRERAGSPGTQGTARAPATPGAPGASREMPGGGMAGEGTVLRGFDDATERIEIIGPGKDERVVLPSSEGQGIEVKMGNQAGRLIYELKVPLRVSETHHHAIGVEVAGPKASVVGIGLETPAVETEALGQPPERGEMPGGMGGRMPGGGEPGEGGGAEGGGGPGGGPGSGPGGMGGRGGPHSGQGEDAKGFEIWCRAKLASGP